MNGLTDQKWLIYFKINFFKNTEPMTIMIRILIYLSYLFGTSEFILTITKRSKQKYVRKKNDRGSLIILWVIIIVGITAGSNLD
jgi:hypothetical protein